MPKLTDRQVEVLKWIGQGCPPRDWPDQTHKNTARALASRGLARVGRKNKVWTAGITEAGEFYLSHGHPMPRPEPPETGTAALPAQPPALARREEPAPESTARQMRRVAARKKSTAVKQVQRTIKETYLRYKVVVTRVQVTERFVRATSEEDAAEKIQAELERPYGYLGSWKTTMSEVDVVEAEQTTVIGPTHLSADGPLLLSIRDAAKALGISYSTLYQMTNQGDIEWVAIGNRKFISREILMDFIKANTHKGYYVAR
ncbi:excisionase family DNA binding protein [Kribbella steppae]|uniref:Excisionase family DNA binding protein n=1 Tax=Kribbella steppae TaxID=2512223 RepID=A0A4R2GX11_9ACTN|nr:helix-turn-helix domain-containing protein [Kribbella steppae]TCO15720.1 excisionase family DNA binding protein [Kribbella steppae]